jgi:hypothetical protein
VLLLVQTRQRTLPTPELLNKAVVQLIKSNQQKAQLAGPVGHGWQQQIEVPGTAEK